MQFPSMAPLQGALPKTATSSGLLHTPNYGAPPYAPQILAQTPSYAPTNPTSKQSYKFLFKFFFGTAWLHKYLHVTDV